jgi:small subunit ribosomal protein S9
MEVINAVGRRKSAIARVYVSEGKGNITVNGKDYKEYFPVIASQNSIVSPLKVTEKFGNVDVKATIIGGGVTGQAEALSLAIARAIVKDDPEQRPALKTQDLLKRDPRRVERKKPGQPKARKKFQFSKR